MNTYICAYKSKKIEVKADTQYDAQVEGAKQLGAKKSYDVIVYLVEKDSKPVTHTADF